MVALNVAIIWQLRKPILLGYCDFASFYTAGSLVRGGHSADLYYPQSQWQVQQKFAPGVSIRRGPLPYVRPPFEALLFAPFAYLSYDKAFVVWTCLKLLVLVSIPFLLTRERRFPPLIEVLICLSFFPVAFDFLQGQDSILLLLIFVCAFLCLRKDLDLQCGLCLGFGLFKFHLVVPIILVFALRSKFKLVAGFISTAFVLFIVSLWLVGWTGVLQYPKYLWRLNAAPSMGMTNPENMPNFHGLLTPLAGNGAILSWIHWFLIVIMILGVLTVAWVMRVGRHRYLGLDEAIFCCSIPIVLVTSYYTNSSDLTLLLLPILLLGRRVLEGNSVTGWPRTMFLAAAVLLLFTPVYWVLAMSFGQAHWIGIPLLLLAISLLRIVQISAPAPHMIGAV
jgi:hypothetical protein